MIFDLLGDGIDQGSRYEQRDQRKEGTSDVYLNVIQGDLIDVECTTLLDFCFS